MFMRQSLMQQRLPVSQSRAEDDLKATAYTEASSAGILAVCQHTWSVWWWGQTQGLVHNKQSTLYAELHPQSFWEKKRYSLPIKMLVGSWQDGSAGKAIALWVWPWNLCGGRRESTPASCPLTSIQVLGHSNLPSAYSSIHEGSSCQLGGVRSFRVYVLFCLRVGVCLLCTCVRIWGWNNRQAATIP